MTHSMCWGLSLRAQLVVLMDTQHYDGSEPRYVDYPITDILQMMGRACRPLLDDTGRCVLLCHAPELSFCDRAVASRYGSVFASCAGLGKSFMTTRSPARAAAAGAAGGCMRMYALDATRVRSSCCMAASLFRRFYPLLFLAGGAASRTCCFAEGR